MNKKLPIVLILCITSIFYFVLKHDEKLFEAKWDNSNTLLAITIDGEISTIFPTTGGYEAVVECTSGNGKVEWNGTKWIFSASSITKGSTKCNITFNPYFSSMILSNNKVVNPITTPGKEVSAYTLNDEIELSKSFPTTFLSYYITYGTGWEANGDKFNLTGAAVTADTFTNSYADLVGKYLPGNLFNFNYNTFSSSTAGTMKATTNLDALFYIVSATKDGVVYKQLTSNKNTTEALLASTTDDYGTSYYFRGNVKNNYVQFANKCWRIVRIVGDGSVKLVLHNDNTSKVANPCSSVNNSASAAFANYDGTNHTTRFNSKTNDNTYVGFMYGNKGANDYASAHANTNKSLILTNLETWYKNNLASYENKLADTIWCNDKSVFTNFSNGTTFGTGLGYGTNDTGYGAYDRVYGGDSGKHASPTLVCPNDNSGGKLSKFTVNDRTNGNGNLDYKIGLLTADELMFAGYKVTTHNSATYLQENTGNSDWWSLSPRYYYRYETSIWVITSSVLDLGLVLDHDELRPAIVLVSTTKTLGGSGTSEDPYVVN